MIPSPRYLVERVFQNLLKTHVHDVREHSALGVARPLSGCARKIEHIALRHQRLEGRTESLFQALGVVLRDLKAMDDVAGNMPAGAQQRPGMPNLSAMKDRDVRGAASQLDD